MKPENNETKQKHNAPGIKSTNVEFSF